MKALVAALAFLFFPTYSSAQDNSALQAEVAQHQKGLHLYQSCKEHVRMMDSTSNDQSHFDIERANECFEYISGVRDALSVIPNIICQDDDLSPNTLIRVYIKFMDDHPTLMDKERVVGIYGALRGQFPCKKR